MIYIDYNATTPLDTRVRDSMRPWSSDKFGNASSRDHAFGWDAEEAVEDARFHVGNLINAKTSEIIFTSCATESINLVLKGLVHAKDANGRTIITSVPEHEAVLGACRQIEARMGVKVQYLPVDRYGNIDLADWAHNIIKGETFLVSLILANNEIGTINPIREVARIAHDAGTLFFTDATQAIGKLSVDVRADGIDLMAFSAHQIYGPKGVGA